MDDTEKRALIKERIFYSIQCFCGGDWEECAACAYDTGREHGWTYELLVLTLVALLRGRGLDSATRFLDIQCATHAPDPWLLTLAELTVGRQELGNVYPKAQRDADRAEVYYFAAEYALARKDLGQALTLFRNAQSCGSHGLATTLAAASVNHLLQTALADHEVRLPPILDEVPALLRSGRARQAIAKARAFAKTINREPLAPHMRALCLNMLGWNLLAAGEHRAAEPLLADAVRRYRCVDTADPEQLANSIHNWAAANEALDDSRKAEALYREELQFEWSPASNQNRIDAALSLTAILQKTGRRDEAHSTAMDFALRLHHMSHAAFYRAPTIAVACARGALQLSEAVLEPSAPEFAALLQSLGRTLRATGEPEEAQIHLERALTAIKAEDIAGRTTVLDSLGANAMALGHPERAEQLFRDVLTLGADRPDAMLASTYINLAQLASDQRDYNKAERLLESALRRIERHEHALSAREVYTKLVTLLLRTGRSARAAAVGERALALPAAEFEASFIEVDLQRRTGEALHALGRYSQAIAHFEQALKLCPEDRSLDTLHLRLDLALSFIRIGRFADADQSSHQAERDIGEWSGDPGARSSILNQLALLREEVQDFEAAERLYKQAIAVLEQANDESDALAALYNNLGVLKQSMGDLRAAREPLERAVTLHRARAPDTPRLAKVLYNIGNQHEQAASSGHLDAQSAEILYGLAERHYAEALTILRRAKEQESLSYVLNTLALALVHQRRGEYTEAEPLYLEALNLAERLGANASTRIVHANNHLAKLYAATGRPRLALATFARTQEAEGRILTEVFALTAETTRLDYVERSRENLWSTLTLASQNLQDPEVVRLAFDCVTRSKALVVDAGAMQRRLETASTDPHIAQLVAEAAALRTGRRRGDEQASTAAHSTRLEEIAVDLARRVFADVRAQLHTTFEDLLAALPKDSALIEVVWYATARFEVLPASGERRFDSPRYLALVVQHAEPRLRAVELGIAEDIDVLITQWRQRVQPEDGKPLDVSGLRRASAALHQAIFDPIIAAVGGIRRLSYCPDATLNLVPLEALESVTGAFLLDNWEITYLTSARDLLRATEPRKAQRGPPVVIADPDYGVGERGFVRLKGTRKEGQEIARLLNTSPWLGKKASKSRLVAASSPAVLHIATHGFFLESGEESTLSDPLQRSGLALAGANDSDDGLLTAADVTALTLGATELVVLSACETGIGILLPGEGVFGLRRSFALAGVRTLVMSLWEVPDEVTKDLMTKFYGYLAAGQGRSKALRQARLDIRGFHSHPFFWGAFICQGDGAPLELNALISVAPS
jgi:CHAT domain-containing protein/tetratricopeptide (TPR) repeat protein